MANRGAPTPPIELPAGGGRRFAGAFVGVTEAVARELAEVCAVGTDPDDLGEHGRDWWPLSVGWAVHDALTPTVPAVVVRPTSTEQVAAVLRIANRERIPVTAMGGRSGVCGASLPVHGGIALDLCGLDGIESVDAASGTVVVGAGMFGDVFEDALRADHSVTCGHWPQSMALSTVGGWVACRGAGQYSTRYGKIEHLVRGLEVVLADGSVVRTGFSGPASANGPDLTQLFVGSEGTLGVITKVQLQVTPLPPGEWRAAYGFASFDDGLEACRRILRRGARPAVLRLYDDRESARSHGTGKPGTPEARHVLLVLDEGDPAVLVSTELVVTEECLGAEHLDVELVERWLHHRNDVSQMVPVIKNDIVVDTVEIAAPWGSLREAYHDATLRAQSIPGTMAATCHLSHSYADGACLYFTIAGRPGTSLSEREDWYVNVWNAISDAVVSRGGALSHHHGIGLNRSRLLPGALGAAFDVLVRTKAALDPNGILNPGKLGLPDPFGPVSFP